MANRLLVTGGSSYLGQHLVPLANRTTEVSYTVFENDPFGHGLRLDLQDKTAVINTVASQKPQTIIHTAGSNRVGDFQGVIVDGTQHVVEAAAAVGARLVHLSTDSVFAGDAAPYDETAVANPLNAYGEAKAKAEEIVAAYPNHVIVRTSLIYGLGIVDHSTAWIRRSLRAGNAVTLFSDQLRNPVWANTLALACLELADNTFQGLLNVAGRQVMSRADFGLKLLDWWGVTARDSLTIAPSPEGRWPIDCRMDVSLATAVLQTPMLGVDEVMRLDD